MTTAAALAGSQSQLETLAALLTNYRFRTLAESSPRARHTGYLLARSNLGDLNAYLAGSWRIPVLNDQ
jgi:hypothetical protein